MVPFAWLVGVGHGGFLVASSLFLWNAEQRQVEVDPFRFWSEHSDPFLVVFLTHTFSIGLKLRICHFVATNGSSVLLRFLSEQGNTFLVAISESPTPRHGPRHGRQGEKGKRDEKQVS
jgi:hypothetical protein